jgi:hypothetical protein
MRSAGPTYDAGLMAEPVGERFFMCLNHFKTNESRLPEEGYSNRSMRGSGPVMMERTVITEDSFRHRRPVASMKARH